LRSGEFGGNAEVAAEVVGAAPDGSFGAEKPPDQPVRMSQLRPDDRRPQCHRVWRVDFAEKLAASVEVARVRCVDLAVETLPA
jgi:hypothetical protein